MTHAAAQGADDDLVGPWLVEVDRLDGQRLVRSVVDGGSHVRPSRPGADPLGAIGAPSVPQPLVVLPVNGSMKLLPMRTNFPFCTRAGARSTLYRYGKVPPSPVNLWVVEYGGMRPSKPV